ncbi:MAG: hypothetical protein NTV57_08060 [Cyanobacteria bacterium]|nr:hypothetical protein [Cyanobacteriota bacterium]
MDVLNTFQLFQSTIYAAGALGISMSSCSRRYRSISEQFDFGFDRVDGVYLPTRNFDMLAALSQAAQKRRLPSMLEKGVIDYWIGVLFDYGSMLEQYFRCLRFERLQVVGAVMAVPSAEGAKYSSRPKLRRIPLRLWMWPRLLLASRTTTGPVGKQPRPMHSNPVLRIGDHGSGGGSWSPPCD